ncbi:MAG: ABC transporter ATP-binding protein [Muribaculaceae bacterium]|nr:ABC transporter ATP-binding protein [Muribaculaceae bacterium]
MLELRRTSYSYRKGDYALKNATASIGPGISLVIGPNGAGKTTLFRILAGMLVPQSGQCLFDDVSTSDELPSLRERIFYLPDDAVMPQTTINEMARRHGVFYPTFSAERLSDNLAAFDMDGNEKLSGMSTGMRKKANVAYALSLGVDLLLLDEPANGLDISSQKILNKLIARNISDTGYIVIATHMIHEMRNMFDNVVVLDRGRVVLSGSTDSILNRWAFVVSDIRPANALYCEQGIDGYHSVVPNTEGINSSIDFTLLYSMLCTNPPIFNDDTFRNNN